MGSLLEKFAGKIDLIYIDPPFATGADFSFHAEVGDSGEEIYKERSVIEEKAYRDTWGRGFDSYMEMMYQRLVIMKELLSEKGSIYLHCDPTASHKIKLLMDAVFSSGNYNNEIIWGYRTQGVSKKWWPRKHDVLLFYSKRNDFIFNPQIERQFYSKPFRHTKIDRDGRHYIDTYLRDVWDHDATRPRISQSPERTGYPTQKPEALLERIIKASSEEGDLVADFFCGSGTTLAVAEKLGRRWIGCDLGRYGVHVSRKRMLDIEGCKPFEVLNLGKYERQYWQGVTFAKKTNSQFEESIFEYFAFILKLYNAQPLPGTQHLHGKKGNAMVHIGVVDAPVTFVEVEEALNECAQLKQSELHMLGWEWEMGLAGPNNEVRKGGPMHEAAKAKSIKLILLQIPREVMEQQAVDKGDIRFFELAYLKASVKQAQKLSVQIALEDFVIPNYELIPEDVREKVSKWSDYIDYWAVDWNFQSDTFMQGWVTYRTRKDRSLKLESDIHTYSEPGKYAILLKVIDIFGNDTSQTIEVEVS